MKCSFCGQNIRKGTGVTFAKLDGTVLNFCSRKCRKYQEMGKDRRKLKWANG